jgi:hypothetical protein
MVTSNRTITTIAHAAKNNTNVSASKIQPKSQILKYKHLKNITVNLNTSICIERFSFLLYTSNVMQLLENLAMNVLE